MIILGREQIQKLWDSALVNAWFSDETVNSALSEFWVDVGGDVESFKSLDAVELIVGNSIRRCNGKNAFFKYNVPMKSFVMQRSKGLNDFLWSRKHCGDFDIQEIRGFKWTIPARTSKKPKTGKVDMCISVREQDKRADWKTIK